LEPRVVGYARDTGLAFIYLPPESRFERLNCPNSIVLDEPFHILTAVEPLTASPRTRRVRPLMAGVSVGNAKITGVEAIAIPGDVILGESDNAWVEAVFLGEHLYQPRLNPAHDQPHNDPPPSLLLFSLELSLKKR